MGLGDVVRAWLERHSPAATAVKQELLETDRAKARAAVIRAEVERQLGQGFRAADGHFGRSR